MVRLVHLRTAGRSVRRTDLPQPLTVRVPHRGAAHLRDRVRRPPLQRNYHLPTGRPLRPTGDTLTLSISGMALGSLIIALTPGYNTIGYAAPILFVVARILQGISAGSEQQSAISFMVEHAPPHRRGLFGSFSNMASGLATLAATGSAAIVTAAFAPATLATWGWRIPFLVGGILGLVGLVLRARADETIEFEAQAVVDKKSAPARLWALLREHPKALLQTAALSAPAVAYYTWATFLPTYAQLTTGRDKASTLTGSVIGLVLLVTIVPICGALSDRLGRRKIFPIVGAIGMVVLF